MLLLIQPLEQVFLALPERDDLVFVGGRPRLLQAVDFPLQIGFFAAVAEPFQGPDRVRGVRRGPLFRGRSAVPGRLPLYLDAPPGPRVQTPRANPAGIGPAGGSPWSPGRRDRSPRAREGPRAPSTPVHQGPNQAPFRIFDLPHRRRPALDVFHAGLPLDGGLADFRPDYLFRNPRFMRQSVGKLVTLGGVGNPRRHGKHLPKKRPPALIR